MTVTTAQVFRLQYVCQSAVLHVGVPPARVGL